MKKLFIYFFLLFSFQIQSCKTFTVTKKKTIPSLQELALLAPASIFDQTTEGISQKEKNLLLKDNESSRWKITKNMKELIVAEAKSPSSKVRLFRVLTKKKNPILIDPILIVFTENEKTQNIQSLIYKKDNFKKVKTLPQLQVTDFFNTKSAKEIAAKYPNAIQYSLNQNKTGFDLRISTWMNEELSELKAENKVSLVWNGNEFNKEIVPIN